MTFGKTVGAMVAVGTMVAAGVLVGTPLIAGAGAQKLNSKLLSVSELPSGWSATHSGNSDEPGPCGLTVFRNSAKGGERVTASFTHATTPTALDEELATGSGELERWKTLAHNLSTCRQTRVTENGTMAHLAIGALSFPKVSRTSRAFAMTLALTGMDVRLDVVLFRIKAIEGFAAYGSFGSTPNLTTVKEFVTAAVDKVEGTPVHLTAGNDSVPAAATG